MMDVKIIGGIPSDVSIKAMIDPIRQHSRPIEYLLELLAKYAVYFFPLLGVFSLFTCVSFRVCESL